MAKDRFHVEPNGDKGDEQKIVASWRVAAPGRYLAFMTTKANGPLG